MMRTKLKVVLEQERISQTLLHDKIKELVNDTGRSPVAMANLSRIITGKQETMWQSTLERILEGINALRTRKKPYIATEILGEVE
jgi:DNA-binding Xre family transcriptional regulator